MPSTGRTVPALRRRVRSSTRASSLTHDDYDSDEDTFVNEGMADLAEFLTGYGVATQSHVDAAAARPENSLAARGDQGDREILTDYGLAHLCPFYRMEQFVPSFIQALFHNPGNGISGINATLATEEPDAPSPTTSPTDGMFPRRLTSRIVPEAQPAAE